MPDVATLKILLAGNWEWQIYEDACAKALTALGNAIVPFAFRSFFEGKSGHYQRGLAALPGPAAFALNRSLVKTAQASKPDVLFVWRGTHVWPATLRAIRKIGCQIVSYNNDDPFGASTRRSAPWHHRYLWTWYLRSLSECDLNFVYRPINVAEAVAMGAGNVRVLPPYFVPELHSPVELSASERQRFACDLVFVGHYEPDGREVFLKALVKAGLHVRIFGGSYWTKEVLGDAAGYFGPVHPVAETEYAKALSGAKMCLAFLSKLNRDVYTRRCFEIPACGRLLVCERTRELQEFFREDEEAIFFSTPDELVQKALWLKDRPDAIERIASAGRRRAIVDGHDVRSRMSQMLAYMAEPVEAETMHAVSNNRVC